jgi:anti-sigma factor RsiW
MTHSPPLTDEDLIALHAGALPPGAAQAMAARVATDPAAQAMLADWQAQDAAMAALYQPIADEPVPARLTGVIRMAETMAPPVRHRAWQIAAAVAVLGLGVAGGWFARGAVGLEPQMQSLQLAALQAHETFVAEVRHPVEVPASDSAHLNTWMSKRMGRDMQPPEFSGAGFALLGGRIVPSPAGPAALYMYEDAQGMRVTLYILPRGQGDSSAFQFAADGATNTVFWSDQGLSCAVVGDLPRDALRGIAAEAYDQLL